MRMPAAIVALLLCGCSSLPPVSYQGTYLGAQTVSKFDRLPDSKSPSFYVNAIWNVGKVGSFQIEPIISMDGREKLIRLAMDVKVDDLMKLLLR